MSSVGPFQASVSVDLPDLDLETNEVREKTKGTSAVEPDAESGDPTSEQENRGFVHILDVIAKEQQKKAKKKARSKQQMYAKDGENDRMIQAYHSLDETDDVLESKGAQINKAA